MSLKVRATRIGVYLKVRQVGDEFTIADVEEEKKIRRRFKPAVEFYSENWMEPVSEVDEKAVKGELARRVKVRSETARAQAATKSAQADVAKVQADIKEANAELTKLKAEADEVKANAEKGLAKAAEAQAAADQSKAEAEEMLATAGAGRKK